MERTLFCLLVFYFLIMATACQHTDGNTTGVSESLRMAAVDTLREVMQHEEKWVKVHAAEFLIRSGYPEGVEEAFREQEALYGTEIFYRIGIWRVLAQTAAHAEQKKEWTDRVMQAFLDTLGQDRIHAVETLAKLKICPLTQSPVTTAQALKGTETSLALYTRWSLFFAGKRALEEGRTYFYERLMDPQEVFPTRRLAAYVLGQSGALEGAKWGRLGEVALALSKGDTVRLPLLSTALMTAPPDSADSSRFLKIKEALLKSRYSTDKADRIAVIAALAEKGTGEDLAVLISWLHNTHPLHDAADNADVRAAAAFAILGIASRSERGPHP